jgi:hypothetical protein
LVKGHLGFSGQLETVDATHLAMGNPWPVVGLEMPGLVLYVMGFVLMALALIRSGRERVSVIWCPLCR